MSPPLSSGVFNSGVEIRERESVQSLSSPGLTDKTSNSLSLSAPFHIFSPHSVAASATPLLLLLSLCLLQFAWSSNIISFKSVPQTTTSSSFLTSGSRAEARLRPSFSTPGVKRGGGGKGGRRKRMTGRGGKSLASTYVDGGRERAEARKREGTVFSPHLSYFSARIALDIWMAMNGDYTTL